jgi:hypothetical protein
MIKFMELTMHTDEQKKFDTRNVDRNIKSGIISHKDYESYLSKLPDASDKVFNPEEPPEDSRSGPQKDSESPPKKKEIKKRVKGKGK